MLETITASSQLTISEDRKGLTLRDGLCTQTAGSLQFHHQQCVLGQKSFHSGRNYWDVDVENEGAWAVGVSEYNIELEKNIQPSPKAGIWAIGRWEGQYRAVVPPDYPPLSVNREPKRIRVCLNYSARELAFFDACTATLLCTYSLTFAGGHSFRGAAACCSSGAFTRCFLCSADAGQTIPKT
ncbi:hypothetical protein JRQ81_003509 [Phrynocephalus forsythii]|uniref:B30.2/SPRY domain-containing protein n=1 Tax=Phrynocephalus forsythii TaxID=171643 RepID=A0A9Q0XKC3_9SAUR|nr:hypothetical protein JRQ81_003509 [Phrynocephalus forsythii]